MEIQSNTNPKILITGGGGYLGYHIALVLKAAGHHVLLYDIRPPMKIWEKNAENFTRQMESCISGINIANSDLITRENLDVNDKILPGSDAFNVKGAKKRETESSILTEEIRGTRNKESTEERNGKEVGHTKRETEETDSSRKEESNTLNQEGDIKPANELGENDAEREKKEMENDEKLKEKKKDDNVEMKGEHNRTENDELELEFKEDKKRDEKEEMKREENMEMKGENQEEVNEEKTKERLTDKKEKKEDRKQDENEEVKGERKAEDVLFEANRGEGSITFVLGDICDAKELRNCMKAHEPVVGVIHTASYGMSGTENLPAYDDITEKINLQGSRNVLQACLQSSVKAVIYTSTVNVVYNGTEIVGGKETDMPYLALNQHTDHYSRTKQETIQCIHFNFKNIFLNQNLIAKVTLDKN